MIGNDNGHKFWIPPDLNDVFAGGIAKVEVLSHGIARIYFYAEKPQEDGTVLKEGVLALVLPVAAIAGMIETLPEARFVSLCAH